MRLRRLIPILSVLLSTATLIAAQQDVYTADPSAVLRLIRADKLDLVLPGAMRDNNVDMWIQVARAGDPDRFGGLAWRVPDLKAARERLVKDGFDVSEHRAGFKPGTQVCTVRSDVHGVPTLLIGPDLEQR